MYKILWDFEIQTDHSISASRLNLVVCNKKKRTCHHSEDFALPAGHRGKRQLLGSCQRGEYEGDCVTNFDWWTWNSSPRPGKEIGGTGDQRNNQKHLHKKSTPKTGVKNLHGIKTII